MLGRLECVVTITKLYTLDNEDFSFLLWLQLAFLLQLLSSLLQSMHVTMETQSDTAVL